MGEIGKMFKQHREALGLSQAQLGEKLFVNTSMIGQIEVKDDKKSSDNTPLISPKHEPDRFLGFWEFYPQARRGSRRRAVKAWDKLKPDAKTINQIGLALKRFKASDDWARGFGIPHASTFINPDNEYWLHPENFLGGAEARGDRPADDATVEGRNLPTWG